MINFVATHLAGYFTIAFMMAFILNLTGTEWTVRRLLFTLAAIEVPHVLLILIFNTTLVTVYTWMALVILAFRISFKQSWRRSIFAGVFVNFSSVVGEYVSLLLLTALPEATQSLMLNNLYISRAIVMICFFLLYIFSKRFKGAGYPPLEHFASTHWIIYFLVFTVFADYNLIRIFDRFPVQALPDTTEISLLILFLYTAEVVVLILFLIFFVFNMLHMSNLSSNIAKTLRLEQRLEKAEQELLHANSMVRVADDLRGFRHDFANYINAMNGFVARKDLPGLEEYLRKLTINIVTAASIELAAEVKEVPALYGVLLEKISRAELRGIHLNMCILIADKLDLGYCSDMDYSRMVGILMDNALEAAGESKNKTIEFSIRAKRGMRVETTVMNSCDKEVDIDRIFDPGYSTKENPSGEGLHQIRRIQEKYQKLGHSIDIKTYLSHGCFIQIFAL